MPLITIAIPAYESRHLHECLASVSAACGDVDFECLVFDDSQAAEGRDRVKSTVAEFPFASLFVNPRQLGPVENFLQCLAAGSGTYVKVLQHDDVLAPGSVAEMVAVLEARPSVVMATSSIALIDGAGKALPDQWWSLPIVWEDMVANGVDLARLSLIQQMNVIGAPAGCVIRRDAIPFELVRTLCARVERAFDVAAWLAIAPAGDVAYYTRPRYKFRLHEKALGGQEGVHEVLLADWSSLIELGVMLGVLLPEDSAAAWHRYLPRVASAVKTAHEQRSSNASMLDEAFVMANTAIGGDIELLAAVLCDVEDSAAEQTALSALRFADKAVLVCRHQGGSVGVVESVVCDWADDGQLADALSSHHAGPVVVLAAGEHLDAPSASRARAALAAAQISCASLSVSAPEGDAPRVFGLGGDGHEQLPAATLVIKEKN